MTEYWPETTIVKSKNNYFNWKEVKTEIHDELVYMLIKMSAGLDGGNATKSKFTALVDPKNKSIVMYSRVKK